MGEAVQEQVVLQVQKGRQHWQEHSDPKKGQGAAEVQPSPGPERWGWLGSRRFPAVH